MKIITYRIVDKVLEQTQFMYTTTYILHVGEFPVNSSNYFTKLGVQQATKTQYFVQGQIQPMYSGGPGLEGEVGASENSDNEGGMGACTQCSHKAP